MKRLFNLAIAALIVWFAIISVRPYWDRYFLQMDIEEAALYGTKRSEGEVRKFLARKMQEKGRKLTDENLFIVKDEQGNVYVKLSYTDEIRISEHTLKRLQFTLDAKQMNDK